MAHFISLLFVLLCFCFFASVCCLLLLFFFLVVVFFFFQLFMLQVKIEFRLKFLNLG